MSIVNDDGAPSGWAITTVENLATNEPAAITDGPFGSNLKSDHYTEAGPRVIRLQNIGDGCFLDEEAHISESHFAALRKHEACAADVVVAMLGEDLPRACLVPESLGAAIVKADCVRLRVHPDLAMPEYVVAGLNSQKLRRQAAEVMHGVGRPRLGLQWFRGLHFPVAPLPEQRRIVEAIASYFSRLDDTVATLERVERNLKRYRASVLKSAVEGRLVPTEAALAKQEGRDYEPASVLLERILIERRRRWAESGKKGKYQEPALADASNLPELPEGWCWATVDQLTIGDRSSGYGVLVPGPDVPDGVLLVRVGDIRNGRVHSGEIKRISKEIADQFQRTYLQGGELLLSLVGSIGRTAVVPNSLAGANVARAVGVIPIAAAVNCQWVEHWFRSPLTQARMVGLSHEVARKTLNLEDVRAAAVALPPRLEQTRIVEAVSDFESLTDANTLLIDQARQRATRLRQSILKWAFEGKLADQDPSDEPASVLLARIKAERDKTQPAKKKSRA